MHRFRRPSLALVVAFLALFVALGTSPVGAAARKVIDGRHLKAGSVSADKLSPAAIASLRGNVGPQGLTGAAGPAGTAGAKGDRGDIGATGASGVAGAKGDRGDVGSTGANGTNGVDGAAGATGATGAPGTPGQDFQYAHVVVVKATGTPAANGTAFTTALAAITDNGAAKPYELLVEPGVYDLGASEVAMKPYVDVVGSGAGVTRLTAVIHANAATLAASANASLRDLTVESTGSSASTATAVNARSGTIVGSDATFVSRNDGAGPAATTIGRVTLDRVTVTAQAANDVATGIVADSVPAQVRNSSVSASSSSTGANGGAAAIATSGSTTLLLLDSIASAFTSKGFAQGVLVNSGNPTFSNDIIDSVLTAATSGTGQTAYALNSFGQPTRVLGSELLAQASTGSNAVGAALQGSAKPLSISSSIVAGQGTGTLYSAYSSSSANTLQFAASELDGALSGPARCVASYKGDFTALSATCG